MRTLYVRIINMTMLIMIASGVIAFVLTNVYYHYVLKPQNDEKVYHIAKDTVSIFEGNHYPKASDYLSTLTDLGYQFHVISPSGEREHYGDPFRSKELAGEQIESVLAGNVYHGIADYPWKPFVTGFFDNELKNTVGVPITINGDTHALFVRPNTTQQFGEMRYFLAILLLVMLVLSFLLIIVSTTFIVRPIKKLTVATKRIAAGNYHLKLNVNRRDEIGRLAADFTKMSDSLAKMEEKRQEFVSNVSHEIQSPLTSIQGFSQALQEEELPREMREHYLSIIESESRRLSTLSKQLLTLSFLDSEADTDLAEPVHIAEQLKDIIASTEWQWREKGITIERDVDEMVTQGNARLLYQVWMNLITNAIRYTGKDGVIRIQAMAEKDRFTVTVADTGIGIAKEKIPYLFERFYKVDEARTRSENSTGLGLSIVKKIVELHNGSILIESELGKGTSMQVSLPRN
ncbi:sensor histidine kinase [Ornithinibacillus gellani]|uniref:sensor histidine kinase n=1 Tax=Ornithinibacillus gellani TaxID=2293253 RepID=UPI000F478094|nr:HAMP domain-containing sensor histidine kinase [Ornithinibacillus gellani]TQS71050.1 sensor histidine kinase [Ornithinibacillus gellani]